MRYTPRSLCKGTKVRIQRDEEQYPVRGSWRHYRGKTGLVTCHNLGEIGVSFNSDDKTDAWFRHHEIERIK